MESGEIARRLRWHAGLGDEADITGIPSIAECTWSGGGRSERVTDAADDFLAALSELNRELNGPVPSEAKGGSRDIPRAAAYAVAEVIRMLRDAESLAAVPERQRMSDAAWAIETSWRAVLAGDIDDLQQHVAEERAARN